MSFFLQIRSNPRFQTWNIFYDMKLVKHVHLILSFFGNPGQVSLGKMLILIDRLFSLLINPSKRHFYQLEYKRYQALIVFQDKVYNKIS